MSEGALAGTAPIDVNSLVKSYGKVEAVRGVSFSVPKGSIFGLIGPDGGGKTTIMRVIVSLLSFDSGSVRFLDRPVEEHTDFVRSHVGYMPQRFSLYQDLTVAENLRFFGDLFGVERSEFAERSTRLYEFSGLGPFSERRAGALSGGMKQKLALCCMLIHSPEVIVLDEPTFGVDPISRNEFWTILRSLRERGTTTLISTAYMDEALLCDRVALVFGGRILANDTPERLKEGYPGSLFVAESDDPHSVYRVLKEEPLCQECSLFGDGVHFRPAPGATPEGVGTRLASAGVSFDAIRALEPGLEDLFLELTKTEGGGRDV